MLRLIQVFSLVFGGYLIVQTAIGLITRQDVTLSWIAFLSNRDVDGNGDIYRMFPDGSRVQRVTHSFQTECGIEWSPDGEWLQVIYVEPQHANYPYCNKLRFEYGRLDYAHRNLTPIPIGISELTISPDGTHIAYADSSSQIYRINTHNQARVQLTDSGSVDYYPAWSPDGRWIAFQSLRGRGYVEFYRMDAVTGEVFQLSDALFGFVNPISPAWSPDSQWLAFFVEDRLFKISVDGGKPILLTDSVGEVRGPAKWSPDGQQIAFVAQRVADTVHVIPADGNEAQRLTYWRIDSRAISWSPDSEWIVYHTVTGDDIEIYRVRRDGSELHQLTDVPNAVNLNPAWSPRIEVGWNAIYMILSALLAIILPSGLWWTSRSYWLRHFPENS